MKIEIKTKPFEHIIVYEMYDPTELYLINRETEFLFYKLGGPEKTNAATEADGSSRKKSGKGIFLDNIYSSQREISDILTITRKVFHDEEIKKSINELAKKSTYFKLFEKTNWDSTLLQYYGDGDYYKDHTDNSIFTNIFTYYKNPKAFYGGDLKFPQFDYYLPIEYNMSILFPSCISHEVTPVNLHDRNVEMSGRFSIANLILWKC